ncbi:MAG: metallophosphoesterase family protein [Elusimicrobiaceae bacterium]|jgi:predicted phosphodiesterase
MKYGIFSDVHSNYHALKAVLKFFKERKVQGYICCGDLVGYGPDPDKCVEEISALSFLDCVMGNHDMAALGKLPIEWFNPYARQSIEFVKDVLSDGAMEFLKSSPHIVCREGFTVVHGSPRNPLEEYMLTAEQFLENEPHWQTPVCFVGHSHVPLVIRRMGEGRPEIAALADGEKINIRDGARYIINPGAVGQPRDRDVRASCGILDTGTQVFELCRIEYDIAKTQARMRELGLAQMLIERIANGW